MRERVAPLLGPVRLPGALAGSLSVALLGQGALVVSGVLAARMLGLEDRGYLALAVFVPVVLAQVAHLGLPQAVTYFGAREPGAGQAMARRVAPIAGGQAAVAIAVHVALLWVFFGGSSREAWTAGVLSLAVAPAGLAQQYGLAVLQGQRRFLEFNVLRVLPASLYSLAVLALFLVGAGGLVAVAAVWVLVQAGVATCTLVTAVRGLPRTSAEAPSRRAMARFGLDGFLGSTSPVETFRVDQALIGLFLAPAALGLYVVGLSFTNLPRFIAQSVGVVAFPRIAAEGDAVTAQRAAWRFVALTLVACAAIVGPLWVAAPWLVPLFFGDEFRGAVVLTRLLLLGTLFLAVRRILSDVTRGLGLPRLGSVAELVSWLVLVPALAVLMPQRGVEGVAIAMVASAGTSCGTLLALAVWSGRTASKRVAPAAEGLGVAAAD